VIVMIGIGLVRSRRRTDDEARADAPWGERFIVGVGVVFSAIVLISIFAISIRQMRAIADQGRFTKLTVRIVSHDWWWEARYRSGAVTANEIHIPAGRRVRLELVTADVIHSFWVPQLAAKTDLIPGKKNTMWIEASAPGRYRGQCAEYCGFQHANMALFVVADRPTVFARWERSNAQPATAHGAGERVFMESTCAGCHTIRGTAADGGVGPDLTHLASRKTIASGLLPNTHRELRDFIATPQDEKPGSVMPDSNLSRADLDALVAYLESLK
jgi:cytochrome c oxidase subunit 2